jgi:hypothetical protein
MNLSDLVKQCAGTKPRHAHCCHFEQSEKSFLISTAIRLLSACGQRRFLPEFILAEGVEMTTWFSLRPLHRYPAKFAQPAQTFRCAKAKRAGFNPPLQVAIFCDLCVLGGQLSHPNLLSMWSLCPLWSNLLVLCGKFPHPNFPTFVTYVPFVVNSR